MVSGRASQETRERYVRNIIGVWHAATPAQEERGRTWYRAAHQLAALIANGDVRSGAGVLAALSANKSWAQNCQLAQRAMATGIPSGHVGDALNKASKIIAGADPLEVLPIERKTGMFFRCIADPEDPDAVVIDRHAHDIAVGETYGNRGRGLSNSRRYSLLADCYREAARRLGELPSTVQAVTWVVHKHAGPVTATP
ncbi:hypothetical protein GCM10022403_083690 [Streptomyces coacervatus]|uniref:Uncharacterized protein n=1 Tax=Streptomyces coacervatus TaxID=647381 RepID=A0ABP7J9T0_9ACTN